MPGTANPEAPGCTTCGALNGTPCDRAVHDRVREAQERAMAELVDLEQAFVTVDLSEGRALTPEQLDDIRYGAGPGPRKDDGVITGPLRFAPPPPVGLRLAPEMVDRIATAIGDPGSVVGPRDWQNGETVTRWSTRAVVQVLERGLQ